MARALPQEVEIKLPVDDLRALRRILRQIGAHSETKAGAGHGPRSRVRVFGHRVFEHNVLFDLPGYPLRKRGALLRLRWQMPTGNAVAPPKWKQSPGNAVLTYKGRASARGGYKVADELEMAVGDPERLTAILAAMGFQPSFR
jgi:adenylate cyclase class IV